MAGTAWQREELVLLKKMLEEGYGYDEIGQTLKRSAGSIRHKARRACFTKKCWDRRTSLFTPQGRMTMGQLKSVYSKLYHPGKTIFLEGKEFPILAMYDTYMLLDAGAYKKTILYAALFAKEPEGAEWEKTWIETA